MVIIYLFWLTHFVLLLHYSPGPPNGGILSQSTEDEHRLIARYAARLAADTKNAVSPVFVDFNLNTAEMCVNSHMSCDIV